jgi:ubiquinone/menaquinone biosynthesis C-methylase UbiE
MDNTDRFTAKVYYYARYRPSYPAAFIDYLKKAAGIGRHSAVADIGAGTGILTKLLLPLAGRVIAVEPNEGMLRECMSFCKGAGNIEYISAGAEDTKLDGGSVDLITVAQAYHWFDEDKTAEEFKRILKPGGKAALVWNRKDPDNGVNDGIDAICRDLCPEYKGAAGGGRSEDDRVIRLFDKYGCERMTFDNDIEESLEGFIGGELSASYSPVCTDAGYDEFVGRLEALYKSFYGNGTMILRMKTYSYLGTV